MYANFTQETCTGTGATLALAGITTGKIPFSKSFSDGDLVAYVLEDSGGTIKVAGVGTYVSATDDITRSDTWNWNGTVIDNNPSTNITLSGGNHTVRCSVIGEIPFSGVVTPTNLVSPAYMMPDNYTNQESGSSTGAIDRMYMMTAVFLNPVVITNYVTGVGVADAGSTNARRGIYAMGSDGSIGKLLSDESIDISSTGLKTTALTSPLKLNAGRYWFAWVSDSATVGLRTFSETNGGTWGQVGGMTDSDNGRPRWSYVAGVTGALPVSPTITGQEAGAPSPMGWS